MRICSRPGCENESVVYVGSPATMAYKLPDLPAVGTVLPDKPKPPGEICFDHFKERYPGWADRQVLEMLKRQGDRAVVLHAAATKAKQERIRNNVDKSGSAPTRSIIVRR